jgi:hypothetical protein
VTGECLVAFGLEDDSLFLWGRHPYIGVERCCSECDEALDGLLQQKCYRGKNTLGSEGAMRCSVASGKLQESRSAGWVNFLPRDPRESEIHQGLHAVDSDAELALVVWRSG